MLPVVSDPHGGAARRRRTRGGARGADCSVVETTYVGGDGARSAAAGWQRSRVRSRDAPFRTCRPILHRVVTLFVGVAVVALSGGCRSLPSDTGDAMTLRFDFDEGPLGFVAGFADYPPAMRRSTN